MLDAVGLAGALIHRGIRLVRLPTTTLAQADAGLGVKNAINALQAKNFYGTFHTPHAVINDRAFWRTCRNASGAAGLLRRSKLP